jgi:hypothetical protein
VKVLGGPEPIHIGGVNMKINIIRIISIMFCVSFILVSETCFAELKNSINVGGAYWVGGNTGLIDSDASGSLFSFEYEHLLGLSRSSVVVGINTLGYEKKTSSGWFGGPGEEGRVNGVDIGFRFYPLGRGQMKKLFLGASLGLSHNEWTWGEATYINAVRAKGDTNATRVDTEIGYRFNLGSEKLFLMPAIHAGHYSVSRNSGKYTYPPEIANQKFHSNSELEGYYMSFALSLGVAF